MIPRPDHFTKDYYLSLKKQGTKDFEIEEQEFIGPKVLYRWKKEIGVIGLSPTLHKGNQKIDPEVAYNLNQSGMTQKEIARKYKMHEKSIYKAIKNHKEKLAAQV